jgi:hypothetical protein
MNANTHIGHRTEASSVILLEEPCRLSDPSLTAKDASPVDLVSSMGIDAAGPALPDEA